MANAILAAILSFLIPGLGQAIAGDIKKGIIFFVAWLIIGLLAAIIFKQWIQTFHIFSKSFQLFLRSHVFISSGVSQNWKRILQHQQEYSIKSAL